MPYKNPILTTNASFAFRCRHFKVCCNQYVENSFLTTLFKRNKLLLTWDALQPHIRKETSKRIEENVVNFTLRANPHLTSRTTKRQVSLEHKTPVSHFRHDAESAIWFLFFLNPFQFSEQRKWYLSLAVQWNVNSRVIAVVTINRTVVPKTSNCELWNRLNISRVAAD